MDTIKALGVRSGLSALLMTGFVLLGTGAAHASGDPVAAAFDGMESKITTYGAAIVGLVVLAVGIFLGIKYLRKGVSKA